MAASSGRNLLVERSTDGGSTWTSIAGLRTKSINNAAEPIDVTTDDDDAWRTLLAEPGNRTLDISVSGITKDAVLRGVIQTATASYALENIRITFPNGDTLQGDFFLTSLSETGEYQDAVTFDAELQSSGEPTYTAAS